MPIYIHHDEPVFHLKGGNTSYVLAYTTTGLLCHLYWGPALSDQPLLSLISHVDRRFTPDSRAVDFQGFREQMPCEFPASGTGDFRLPAIEVIHADGSSVVDFRYVSGRLIPGKPPLAGLPAVYAEDGDGAETLEIVLEDAPSRLRACLLYTVFPAADALMRSVRLENAGVRAVRIERMASASVDIGRSSFDTISLSGSWGRERRIDRAPLKPGTFSVESARGVSSHQYSPFIALADHDANETSGTAFALSFVYSGNFFAEASVEQFGTTRLQMGINPRDFSWLLEPGETFQAPEVVMVHSASGFRGLSKTFHALYGKRLARGTWRDRERPILVNNWEATYFDFDQEKITDIARAASRVGIETLVLDDGWFGHRDRDDSSLGDWVADRRKLPDGLDGLARRINDFGLTFGLWFEPEMVSPDSDLYRAHPDWCIHVNGRHRTQMRNQLVLDYSRPAVRDHIVATLSSVLESAPIAYVKWDMNRGLTEVGSAALAPERQRETAHRYCLGVYEVMERVTSRFPNVLFESCSSGGARFDAGLMYYMPQAWTSDDMDPLERLKIQWSTSLVFPASMIGTHVGTSPNHTTHRILPLKTRGAVAMSGAFGYELDLSRQTEEDLAAMRVQVAFFRAVRDIVQFGDFYRLVSPYFSDEAAWSFVSPDKSDAFVVYVRVRHEPNAPVATLRLSGLDPGSMYHVVEGFDEGLAMDRGTGFVMGGDVLMNAGMVVPCLSGDMQCALWRLRVITG